MRSEDGALAAIITELAEELVGTCLDSKARKAAVFVESTFQVESCSYRNSGKAMGRNWTFGANVLMETNEGQKRMCVYDAEKLRSIIGPLRYRSIADASFSTLPRVIERGVPDISNAEIHDVVFSRNIAVAKTESAVVCSQHGGRRIELEIADGEVGISRRWLSKECQMDVCELISTARRELNVLKGYESLGENRSPVVFHGATSALLLHELLGHPLESDNYKYAKPWLDRIDVSRINPQIEFYDDPTLRDGYGSYTFDDMGVPAKKWPLLVHKQFHVLGAGEEVAAPQRRQDYRFPALPRASNALICGGPDSLDSLSATGENGLLHVYSIGAGRIDNRTGDFEYSAPEAEWVDKNGRKHVLTNVLLMGSVKDMLESIDGVADDVREASVTCGKKGQYLAMGARSPSVRFGAVNWAC